MIELSMLNESALRAELNRRRELLAVSTSRRARRLRRATR